MSKIGKKNIHIPKESSIKIDGSNLTITGPKGSTQLSINDKSYSINLEEESIKQRKIYKPVMQTSKYMDVVYPIGSWCYLKNNQPKDLKLHRKPALKVLPIQLNQDLNQKLARKQKVRNRQMHYL